MSGFESKLKEENENNKELFNFNANEAQSNDIQELFTNSIKNSKNDSKIFVKFLEFYSKSRPSHQPVSRELVKCLYSCFLEQINDIQKDIKNTSFLKFIIFPEEFPMKESKEQKEMFLLLEKDDIDGFISFLSKNPTIDLTKQQ